MMDFSTVTSDGTHGVSETDVESIRFVLIVSAQLNGRLSGNRAAIGLCWFIQGTLQIRTKQASFLRTGLFYSEPQVVGGTDRFNQNDVVEEINLYYNFDERRRITCPSRSEFISTQKREGS